jgi:hypothetical protein
MLWVSARLGLLLLLDLGVWESRRLANGGRDVQARVVLESCQGVLGELHEAGADAALWHAAAGVALYHCENLQVIMPANLEMTHTTC